jgi:hypothetical protein
MKMKYLLIGLVLLVAAMALAACGQPAPAPAETAAPPAPTQACPEVPEAPACPTVPEPVVATVPFEEQWASSPHNDASAEAFIHWNEEDPAEVPASCAKCHSTPGYLDFLGADGTAAGSVENAAEIGTTVTCAACHNDATTTKTSVVFPSGIEITGLGDESRCMECHQGRASTVQVDEAITTKGGEDLDAVSAELGFVNIHYFAAAATRLGTEVKGGYEYAGKTYDARFDHVAGYDTCTGCHNPHTLEVKVDQCAACHTGVAGAEDLKSIRMAGSLMDYDGDGDISEGVGAEIEGLQGMLLSAIQAYGAEVAGTAIVYDSSAYPYFFIDTNTNGTTDEGEAAFPNAYKSWTGRMLRAAYNFQTSLKDPGAYAHGGKYMVELLYDSIEDLNTVIATPVDLSTAHRVDAGHFASSEEPFRHWDAEGLVPGDCAKCHTASGLPTFLGEASRNRDGVTGVNIAADPSSGLNCATCHDDVSTFTRFTVEQVKFPSGAIIDSGNPDSNLCLQCHQGRESMVSVNAAIQRAGAESDDTVSEALSFRNPHYFAAGATLLGTEAKGAYEYSGKTYNPRFAHVPGFNTCVNCHDTHALTVNVQACSSCHTTVQSEEDLQTLRMTAGDFDGDGDETEGLAQEVATMEEQLFLAMQAYATENSGTGLVYDGHTYPYFFADTNGNGEADEDERNFANSFKGWTPRLLRAAYNFQWVAKDPGAFAHNGEYILQVLYDSLEDIGGDVTGKIRPTPPAP